MSGGRVAALELASSTSDQMEEGNEGVCGIRAGLWNEANKKHNMPYNIREKYV